MAAMRDSVIINYSSRGRRGRGAAINGESLPVFLSESSHNNVSTANLCFPSLHPCFPVTLVPLKFVENRGWCNFRNKQFLRGIALLSSHYSLLLPRFWLKLRRKGRGKNDSRSRMEIQGYECFCSKGGKFFWGRSFLKAGRTCNDATTWRNNRFMFLFRVTKCIIMSSSCKISTKFVVLLNIVTHTYE